MINKILSVILMVIILCGCAMAPQDLPKLYKKNVHAVVAIHVERVNPYTGERKIGQNGTGFIIDKYEGFIVTANHVVSKSPVFLVELSIGLKIEAKIHLADPENDIVILKINPKLLGSLNIPVLQLEIAPAVGEPIFSIGHPNGYFNTVSLGILSRGLTFDILNMPILMPCGVYLADFHGFYGSSGCPAFNLKNKVIGMVAGVTANFVIIVPANSIDKVLKQNGV